METLELIIIFLLIFLVIMIGIYLILNYKKIILLIKNIFSCNKKLIIGSNEKVFKNNEKVFGNFEKETLDDLKKEIDPKYLYTKYPKFCCDKDPDPMFEIGDLKWDKDDDTILEKMDLLDMKEVIDEDTRFLYYLMCSPKMKCLVSFNKKLDEKNYIYKKELKDIDYYKNIFYQVGLMNLSNDITKHSKIFDEYMDDVLDGLPKKINIYIYFFEDPTKINKQYNEKLIIENSNFYNLILIGKLVLNKNSLEFLQVQDLNGFNAKDKMLSRIKLNSYIKYLNTKVSLLNQTKITTHHGILTYYIGLRGISDLDVIIYNDDEKLNDIDKYLKYVGIDKFTKDSYDTSLAHIIERNSNHTYPNIKYYYGNLKYFGYIFGITCVNLYYNMRSRFTRQRPKALAEIIAFNNKNPKYKYPLPPLPQFKYIYSYGNTKTYITDLDIILCQKDPALRKAHPNMLTDRKPINKYKFLNTILFYLKTSYNIKHFNKSKLEKLFNEDSCELEDYDKKLKELRQ